MDWSRLEIRDAFRNSSPHIEFEIIRTLCYMFNKMYLRRGRPWPAPIGRGKQRPAKSFSQTLFKPQKSIEDIQECP
jgi:hypothetical protein